MKHQGPKPIGAVWRPVRNLDKSLEQVTHEDARNAATRCADMRRRLEDAAIDRSAVDIWLRERNHDFAIETDQIEGLYVLRRGVTETLNSEGFESARGHHSISDIGDKTLKGRLFDQEAALDMLFSHVKEERPLTCSAIKEWHALLTRHQANTMGIDPCGNIVQIPLRKGEWKTRPNNKRRTDGHIQEYCPPEQVQTEMDRFLAFHESHHGLGLAPEVEAAWFHHDFARIHPFEDGNGRISRLLMAFAYAKAGEFPPVITAQDKPSYIDSLEAADRGNCMAFVQYLGNLATLRSANAVVRAERILSGGTHDRHGNGGVTSNGVYHPPHERSRG